jgi:FkbM family methyltransferase
MNNNKDAIGLFKFHQLANPKNRMSNIKTISELCHNAYLGDYINICRMLGRFNIFVDSRDRGIGMHLLMRGLWEMYITEYIAANVKKNMTVLDVGANYGYYSLLMAQLVGPEKGKVISFEANPHLSNLFNDSVNINGFRSRVLVNNIALSDEINDSSAFYVPHNAPMNGHLISSREKIYNGNIPEGSINVKTTTLDNVIEPGTKIDFAKVDIEGAEYQFWLGSTRVRKENPQMKLLLEFNAGRYQNPGDFIDIILSEGYSLCRLQKDSNLLSIEKADALEQAQKQDIMLLIQK